MKKFLVVSLSIILLIFLNGCLVAYVPEYDSEPTSEALFELPDNASVVSETFTFSATSTDDFYGGIEMIVTARYTIQNNGEDGSMQVSVPFFPIDMRDSVEKRERLTISQNEDLQSVYWDFRFDPNTFSDYDNLTHEQVQNGLLTDDQYQFYTAIYGYEFTVPLEGEDQELTVTIPEGTHILSDYYMAHEEGVSYYQDGLFECKGLETVIPATTLPTTGRFYTIGAKAEFTGNYDFHYSYNWNTAYQLAQSHYYNDMETSMYIYQVHQFYNSDEYSMNQYDPKRQAKEAKDLVSVFSSDINLLGNGEQTVIEVTYPFLSGATTDKDAKSVYSYYDFYFDSLRYLEEEIPVTIILDTDLELFSSSYDIDSNDGIVFDITNGNHLLITFQSPWNDQI